MISDPEVASGPGAVGASMRFCVLGPLAVEAAGRSVELVGSRVKSLLVILLAHANTVVPVDRLMDDLWAGEPTPGASATLQGYVSELRRSLADALGARSPILTRRPGYLIEVGVDQFDMLRFERLIASAKAATRDQPDLVGRLLREALSLWRGPALADFASEQFAHPIAARLEEQRLWALETRVDIDLATGLHCELVSELHQLTGEFPLHERFWGQQMLSLYRCGRQADALRTYQDVRRFLNEELAIEPSPVLQRLEHAILDQDPSLELPRGAVHRGSAEDRQAGRDPVRSERKHNLPAQLTKFIGRAAELEQARRLLSATRVLTLTGTGGAGKTRVAVELAVEEVEHFSGGVWFVDLAAMAEGASVLGAVARALGLAEPEGADLDALIGRLGTDDVMIVLDNCEQVVDPCAELVEELLSSCSQLKFLATSREELRVGGETVWRVPSLSLPSVPDTSGADIVQGSEAMQLFVERASTALPAFDPDDHALAAVARICRRLDGIPLAIELAAALVPVFSVDEISGRLDHRFELLTRGARRAVPRQRTLRATIDWSYDLLDEAERDLFSRLSVFVGEFTLEAAEAVAGNRARFLPAMSALVSKSMVVAVSGSGGAERYRLLDSLRQYGLERLGASSIGPDARERHAAYYCSFAEAADAQLHSSDASDWSDHIARELPNIRAALDWSFSDGDLEVGVRLAGALRWWFFGLLGHLGQAREWLDVASERRNELRPALLLKALTAAMNVAFSQGDYATTSQIGEEAVRLAETLDDRRELAAALMARGGAAVYEGDLARAVQCLERSLGYCRELGDRWGAAWVLTFSGVASRRAGQDQVAETQLDEALSTFRYVRDVRGQVYPLVQLALLAQNSGDLDRAGRLAEEAMALTRQVGEPSLTHIASCILGRIELERGHTNEARRLLVASVRSYRGVGHPVMVAIAVEGLAILGHREDRHLDAVELWGFADHVRADASTPLTSARQEERGRYLIQAREELGDDVVEPALRTGRQLSTNDVLHRIGTGETF